MVRVMDLDLKPDTDAYFLIGFSKDVVSRTQLDCHRSLAEAVAVARQALEE